MFFKKLKEHFYKNTKMSCFTGLSKAFFPEKIMHKTHFSSSYSHLTVSGWCCMASVAFM